MANKGRVTTTYYTYLMCLAAPLHELRRTGTYKQHTSHTACSMCVRSRGAAGDEGTAAQQSMNADTWLCLLVQCTPADGRLPLPGQQTQGMQ